MVGEIGIGIADPELVIEFQLLNQAVNLDIVYYRER
jgi:hypothetical protein